MKAIIIGNKDIEKDISDKLKEFDIIIRINRCTNWEKTKTDKIDTWLMDLSVEKLFDDFKKIPCIDLLYNANKLFFYENSKNVTLYSILSLNGLYRLNVVSYIHSLDIKKYIPEFDFMECRPSNFVWMILFTLENLQNCDIYITACDIENRSHLIENKFHKNCIKKEEKLLKTLINEGKIKFLPFD